MKQVVAAASAVLFCACATVGQKESAPKIEQQQITNLGYFDVAACEIKPPAIPERVNTEVLTGVLVAARPHVMECLVEPKNRGPEKTTQVVVDSTLIDTGVEHKVTGQNLTPTGVECVKNALQKYTDTLASLNAKNSANLPPAPPPPPAPVATKGKKAPPPPPPASPPAPTPPVAPITAHVEFQHLQGINPSVVFGANDASDVIGQIRLSQPSWCECYTPWKSNPPHLLTLALKVARPPPVKPDPKKPVDPKAPPPPPPDTTAAVTELTFPPTGDAVADQVATCLQGKIQPLKFNLKNEGLTLPAVPLRYVHSGESRPIGGASPDLQFTQFDLLRNQTAAETAIAVGTRSPAVIAYDSAVKQYKDTANSKKGPTVTVKELQDKCAALLKTDDKVIGALKNQFEVEKSTHDFAAAQLAKDPAWKEAEAATAEKLEQAQKDVVTWEQTRKADEAACPKVKY